MKEGWTYKKLGEVATFARGLTYSKKDEVDFSANVVLRSNNIDLSSGKLDFSELKYLEKGFDIPSDKRVKKGSLFICMSNGSKAHLGKVAYVDKDYNYAFGGFMGQITPNNEVDGLYLHYVLSSPVYKDYIKSLSEGANINNLKFKDLSEFVIAYPSLSEQHSIVARLDAAFAHIDALKANAEKQLAEARQLFQAELTECMRPKEGWDADTLIEVYNFIDYRGATPNKIQSGVPLVTAKNVKYGYIDYTIKDFISREEYETRKSRGVSKKGDILFTTEAPLGNVAIADLDEFSAGQRLITLQQYKKPKYTVVNEFYFYYMLSSFFQNRVKELATGATAQGIKAKLLKTVNVPIPPIEVQHQIVSRLDALSANIKKLEEMQRKTLAECDALKQAMLRELFE